MLSSLCCRRQRRGAAVYDEASQAVVLYICVQTQSASQWGLFQRLCNCLRRQGARIMDHRTTSQSQQRGDVIVHNELFCRLPVVLHKAVQEKDQQVAIDQRLRDIHESIANVIQQPSAKICVQRWYPEQQQRHEQLVEEENNNHQFNDQSCKPQATTNQDKDYGTNTEMPSLPNRVPQPPATRSRTSRRQKTRSTPILGGLFDTLEDGNDTSMTADPTNRVGHFPHKAQLIVHGEHHPGHGAEEEEEEELESYNVLVPHQSLSVLRGGGDSTALSSHRQCAIEIQRPVLPREQLYGLVRRGGDGGGGGGK